MLYKETKFLFLKRIIESIRNRGKIKIRRNQKE
jgi:hypothetical protein